MDLSRVELFSQAPVQLKGYVLSQLQPREIKKGDFIYRAGQIPNGIYLIDRGLVGLVAITQSGAQHLLRCFKAGQFFGHRSLLAGEPYHAHALAMQDTKLWFFSGEVFLKILSEYPQVALKLMSVMAGELGRAERRRVSITEKDVASRIAEALLYFDELHKDYSWTRREVAEFCGTTTATVIRTMGRFEEEGLIRQMGRRVEIVKHQDLVDLAARD